MALLQSVRSVLHVLPDRRSGWPFSPCVNARLKLAASDTIHLEGGKMTDVLVVDDNAAIRMTVRSILEFEGYDVCEAADGQFALEHLRTHARDHVILLDVEMPRLNGVQMLETLEQQGSMLPRHEVIMMTASTLGMPPAFTHIPILSKPFDFDVLVANVAHVEQRLLAAGVASQPALLDTSTVRGGAAGHPPARARTPIRIKLESNARIG